MTITVELPDDLATHENAAREALEALAIAGYRSGALTTRAMRLLLGFGTRYELDGFLKHHRVFERSYGIKEYEEDIASMARNECAQTTQR
jgi:hypothetical protein